MFNTAQFIFHQSNAPSRLSELSEHNLLWNIFIIMLLFVMKLVISRDIRKLRHDGRLPKLPFQKRHGQEGRRQGKDDPQTWGPNVDASDPGVGQHLAEDLVEGAECVVGWERVVFHGCRGAVLVGAMSGIARVNKFGGGDRGGGGGVV